MLALTTPYKTFFHRITAGKKLLFLCIFTTLIFQIQGLLILTLTLLIVFAMYISQGAHFTKYGISMLRPLWPFVIIIAVYHGIIFDIANGAKIILRMLTAVSVANLITMTTALDDMTTVFMRLLSPLRSFGLNSTAIALALALFVRSIPVLIHRGGNMANALKARSVRTSHWRIIAPLALSVLDDAENVAYALKARGGIRESKD